jgi:hypothetical protein
VLAPARAAFLVPVPAFDLQGEQPSIAVCMLQVWEFPVASLWISVSNFQLTILSAVCSSEIQFAFRFFVLVFYLDTLVTGWLGYYRFGNNCHGLFFLVNLGQWSKVSKEIWGSHSPPLVAVFGPLATVLTDTRAIPILLMDVKVGTTSMFSSCRSKIMWNASSLWFCSFLPSPDIDECQLPDIYPCHGTCINMPGTYRCSSKKSIRSHPGT